MSKYIIKRGEIFYYYRRVPKFVQPYESRKVVKISLDTSDEKEAGRKASVYNDYIEDFWRSLIKVGGAENIEEQYKATVQLAKAYGFAYKSVAEIAKAPLEEITARLQVASKNIDNENTVTAVLGGTEQPSLLLSECAEKFWPLSSDRLVNKSEHQIRKWKNPRKAALENFINVVGDKPLAEVTRSDVLKFRQWWMERVENGSINAGTVNKSLMYTCDLLKVVGMAYEINTDFDLLFAKIRLKELQNSRPPFEAEYVQNVLLSSDALNGLNQEARLLIFAMADTGARESELIGLQQEDIFLDKTIPYIWIRPKENHSLKTVTSERQIPLVGSSLHAFKQLPTGFVHYRNADTVSATVNKYLRENNLKPTVAHTLYSLRHSFKDRLRDAEAPEEIIDELMGHKKSGPKYGRGHILEKKYNWLRKIAFRVDNLS